MESSLRLPESLKIFSPTLSDDFQKWKEQVEVYPVACRASEKTPKTRESFILNCAGPGIISAAKHFEYREEENRNDSDVLISKIAAYCNPMKNETLDAYKFWNVKWNEGKTFEHFLTEIRSSSESCNFGINKDRMLRDKLFLRHLIVYAKYYSEKTRSR